jgi:hypothetical protein
VQGRAGEIERERKEREAARGERKKERDVSSSSGCLSVDLNKMARKKSKKSNFRISVTSHRKIKIIYFFFYIPSSIYIVRRISFIMAPG